MYIYICNVHPQPPQGRTPLTSPKKKTHCLATLVSITRPTITSASAAVFMGSHELKGFFHGLQRQKIDESKEPKLRAIIKGTKPFKNGIKDMWMSPLKIKVLINRKRFDQSKIGFQQRNPGFNKENWG